MGGDDLLHRDEPSPSGRATSRGRSGGTFTRAMRSSPVSGVAHPHHQVEREVGDVGERVALVDGQRGEHREDLAVEHVGEVGPVGVVEGVPVGEDHAGLGQGRADSVEEDRLCRSTSSVARAVMAASCSRAGSSRRGTGCGGRRPPGPPARPPAPGRTRPAPRRRWPGT